MKRNYELLALLTLLVGFAFTAQAQLSPLFASGGDCNNLVINHSYSQQFEGVLNVPVYYGSSAPPGVGIVPTAGAGFLTFHDGGKVSGQITIAIGLLGLFRDLQLDNTSEYSLTWNNSKTPAVCSGTVAVNTLVGSLHFQLLVGLVPSSS